jgi:hypothetical protein
MMEPVGENIHTMLSQSIQLQNFKYCKGFAQRVVRQHLCKHGDYATAKNAALFCVSTADTTWQQYAMVT